MPWICPGYALVVVNVDVDGLVNTLVNTLVNGRRKRRRSHPVFPSFFVLRSSFFVLVSCFLRFAVIVVGFIVVFVVGSSSLPEN